MKPSQIAIVVADAIENPHKRPLFIEGAPGVGKTSVVRQVCDDNSVRLIDKRVAGMEPSDALFPMPNADGFTRYSLPDWLPKQDGSDGPCAIFLDEFPQGTPMVMNSFSELILDRTFGGAKTYRLPDDCLIIAAGNRRSDRAATNEMPSHLKSRFRWINFEHDTDDWVHHALRSGIREEVIAFIRHRPNLLLAFDPKEKITPSPRTWEAVSDDLPFVSRQPSALAFEVIAGSIGEGAAVEFTGFLRMILEMPDPDDVFRDPLNTSVPSDPAMLYAMMIALASRVTLKNRDALFPYLNRVSQDFAVTCVKDAMAREPTLLNCKTAFKWVSDNKIPSLLAA